MTNPQNCQYFGSKNPYPLQISEYHRFLIPNVDNEIDSEDLSLWIGENQIAAEFGISDSKLFRISIYSSELISGQFQIKNGEETIFWSNCVEFLDSTDNDGRKFIRVATKHYYNRNLFAFNGSDFDWMVTNLPAYDFGQFQIESEYNTVRNGDSNSLLISDSYIDEVVSYQFIGDGDSNVFSSIMAHVLNSEFYIDGTKRTIKEQPELEDFAMYGIMKFVNQKDKNGLNITMNYDDIFTDAFIYALGNDEKTLLYTHTNNEYAIPI